MNITIDFNGWYDNEAEMRYINGQIEKLKNIGLVVKQQTITVNPNTSRTHFNYKLGSKPIFAMNTVRTNLNT